MQRKTIENDGYEAVALAFGDVKKSRVTRALAGHYKKAGHRAEARRSASSAPGSRALEVGADRHRRVVRRRRPRRRARHLEGPRLRRRHQALELQRRRREPRFDDPSSAGFERRHQRRRTRPRAAAVRATTASTRITHQNFEVVRADAERNLLLVRGPVPGADQRARRRDALGQESQGERLMPQVIDAKGKSPAKTSRSRRRSPSDVVGQDERDVPRGLPRAREPARRHALDAQARRSPRRRHASRGSRRAPAARAKVRSVRRSGVTAASSSGRSRARYVSALNKKERKAAMRAALSRPLPERIGHGARNRQARRLKKTQRLRDAVLRFAEGRQDRPAHAGRVRRERTGDRSASSLARTGSNLATRRRHAHRRARHQRRRRLRAAGRYRRCERRADRRASRQRRSPHDLARHYHRAGDHREVDGRHRVPAVRLRGASARHEDADPSRDRTRSSRSP